MMSKNALFIGRFQPFHLGHLSVIQKALQENDRLFIGIGSSEANFQPENPFTCSERFQMIEAALDELCIPRQKYDIVTIRNIDNFALWVQHVELYIPPFQKIYTGSEIVKFLYQYHNTHNASSYEIIQVEKKLNISATKIRQAMIEGIDWKSFVPPSVAVFIAQCKGVERVQHISFSS